MPASGKIRMYWGALRGMGAVAAGLIVATGLRLADALKRNAMGKARAILLVLRQLRVRRAAALAADLRATQRGQPWLLLGVQGDRNHERARIGCFCSATALALSLMSVGGAISTLPEMHRFLVDQQRWLSNSQFNASIALAQAAPGPNVLFVALFGWNIGLNAGSTGARRTGVSYYNGWPAVCPAAS